MQEQEDFFAGGNELLLPPKASGRQILDKINGPNMFGVVVDTHQNRYELTDNEQIVKLERQRPQRSLIENMLPLSTYYQTQHTFSKDQLLSPDIYLYRKAVIVSL
ncbi:hypothetical protein [uncultured Enterococcus sp.]|uniref:hypothetical protein n=1 Tax=uncultured Enterococcus sp. TaxID=167972 RepID=UPI002AA918B3|nr:hypothetical protein [uncultured Enterococcus sp.]